jgi:hypothetical protein
MSAIDLQQLSQEEQIEFRLGKDRYPDLFFKSGIPQAWEIELNLKNFLNQDINPVAWKDCKNISITHDSIEYKFNNLGYRSHYDYFIDELKTKQNILCLGDSDIFGPYKEYSQIWTTQLQTQLPEYNIINMGMPGWSPDTMVRSGVSTIKALGSSIQHICLIWPVDGRREFISKQYKKIVGLNGVTDIPYENYWDHVDWVSNNYNLNKNINLIKFVAIANKINYIDLQIVTLGKKAKFDGDRFGKGVFGPATQTALSRWFYKKIKGQPSLYESLKKPNATY